MYMLMPDEPHIGFVTLAVIFVSATLLGFASHAPGGIGVFDAAMLIALWQFDREPVLAGLLLFRLVYYIIPFALALDDPGPARARSSTFTSPRKAAAAAPGDAGGGSAPGQEVAPGEAKPPAAERSEATSAPWQNGRRARPSAAYAYLRGFHPPNL